MRIAVAGATGHIGTLTVSALEHHGHDVVAISRSLGVDLLTGDGLDGALEGVDAVVDVTNSAATDRAEAVVCFGTATANLLAAEQRAGVRHHVLLSIVGVDRVEGNAHYAGKREQERLVAGGPVPWTIVRAMARRTNEARGHRVRLIPSWSDTFGVSMAGEVLLPGAGARIAPTTFDEWLAAGAR